jgi:tRNA threonylcarbamoyladenosine biosynthesis protein TsaE
MTEKTFLLSSEVETAEIARKLAAAIATLIKHSCSSSPSTANTGLTLHLSLIGDLGAGKTTFTRHLLKALGHQGKVKSPTYTLCEPYQLIVDGHEFSLHHFDLYRMRYAEEWLDAGFRDTFSNSGVCVVEWPEKAEGTLPSADAELHLFMNDDESRQLIMHATSQHGQALLNAL